MNDLEFARLIAENDFKGKITPSREDEIFKLGIKAEIICSWDLHFTANGQTVTRSYTADEVERIIEAFIRLDYWDRFLGLMTQQHSWGCVCEVPSALSALFGRMLSLMRATGDDLWGEFNIIRINIDKSDIVVFRMFSVVCFCRSCVKTVFTDILFSFRKHLRCRHGFVELANQIINHKETRRG